MGMNQRLRDGSALGTGAACASLGPLVITGTMRSQACNREAKYAMSQPLLWKTSLGRAAFSLEVPARSATSATSATTSFLI
mmetsp:Transcript_48353/g.110199  ORF Transcript_48353/g.110199 Transcript_48353/m.110199 type:complete len:81 (+) Transcript_48353:388-630(+)